MRVINRMHLIALLPIDVQRAEADALMSSTETMMKFGFMSMSMTYFSSLNMIKAMKQVGTANILLANPQTSVALQGHPGAALSSSVPTQAHQTGRVLEDGRAAAVVSGVSLPSDVTLWSVADVLKWLDALSLSQYSHVFAEAVVDGEFLFDLDDQVCVSCSCGVGGSLACVCGNMNACVLPCLCTRVCFCVPAPVCM
jgi:hypothetical protein